MPVYANAKSVKQAVVDNIITTLLTITQANGYFNDVAAALPFKVAGWELMDMPTLLVIGLREQKDELTAGPENRTNVTLTGTIQIHATMDPASDTEEYHNSLICDVETALRQDVTRGGVARYTEVEATDLTLEAQASPSAVSIITFRVNYQHSSDDPTKPW